MARNILRLTAFMLYALVFAVFWGTWFSQSRSMDALSAGAFLENGRQYIANLAMPMRFLMPACLVTVFAWAYALRGRNRRAAALALAAGLLMTAALIITLSVNVPIDNRIKAWTLETLPADWARIRDHWEAFHCLRAWLSFAGLACLAAADPAREA
jgi:hypothetical protein